MNVVLYIPPQGAHSSLPPHMALTAILRVHKIINLVKFNDLLKVTWQIIERVHLAWLQEHKSLTLHCVHLKKAHWDI